MSRDLKDVRNELDSLDKTILDAFLASNALFWDHICLWLTIVKRTLATTNVPINVIRLIIFNSSLLLLRTDIIHHHSI